MIDEKMKTQGLEFHILINEDLTATEIEYIFDCWVVFVTQDLGKDPNSLIMYLGN